MFEKQLLALACLLSAEQAARGEMPIRDPGAVETRPADAETADVPRADLPPAETAPAETAPAETVPAETVPAETAPAETVPAETTSSDTAPTKTGRTNLVMPTLGGTQLWGDELFFHQWRIQKNVVTGHCRLLDEKDRRHAWGSYDQCLAGLERIKREQTLPPMQGKAVIVLHGIIGVRGSARPMCEFLQEQGGYEVFNVSYPSTRAEVGDHAVRLAHIVEHLEGIEEINFVAHSMGNLIIRHYLASHTDETAGLRPDERIKRIVMLGPPNHGAPLSQKYAENKLYQAIFGISGRQLGSGWEELEPQLTVPRCEFAILAGGKGDGRGYNPLVPGDDDAIVNVSTTRLAGARDFAVLPLLHWSMMDDRRAAEYALRFLQDGYFTSEQERRPVDDTPVAGNPVPEDPVAGNPVPEDRAEEP